MQSKNKALKNVGDYDAKQKLQCTGCMACVDVCPNNAVSYFIDEEGFIYPKVDQDLCVDCGRCINVCCVDKSINKGCEKQNTLGAYSKIDNQISESSSGGIAYTLSKMVIEQLDGIAIGAYMGEDFYVKHIIVKTVDELKLIQGSKYVQSDIRNIYKGIFAELQKGKFVLFSGTPCQVYAVKKRFENHPEYEKLLLIDLVCHGCPSQRGLKYYIESRFQNSETVKALKFKKHNANEANVYGFDVLYNDYHQFVYAEDDPWYYAFLNGLSFRESCYVCKFANTNRVGDITLGDCACSKNIYRENPEISDKPISLVVINSLKGEMMWDRISKSTEIFDVDLDKEKRLNHQLCGSVKRDSVRSEFYKWLFNDDIMFDRIIKPKGLIRKARNVVWRNTKAVSRWKIRKIIGV